MVPSLSAETKKLLDLFMNLEQGTKHKTNGDLIPQSTAHKKIFKKCSSMFP